MPKFSKSKKNQKKRIELIIDILKKQYPDIKIQLDHSNTFELLIATMLSAQCTDARVNIVTKALFEQYKTPQDFLDVPLKELEKAVFSTGFYKAKAKNIKKACFLLIDKFEGEVPDNMRDLTSLAGVGRKTANVLLGHKFNTPGIVVDTHVTRISNRLGFTDTKDAVKIEYKLMDLIKKEDWVDFTHLLIYLGRETCTARKIKCEQCLLTALCPNAFL